MATGFSKPKDVRDIAFIGSTFDYAKNCIRVGDIITVLDNRDYRVIAICEHEGEIHVVYVNEEFEVFVAFPREVLKYSEEAV